MGEFFDGLAKVFGVVAPAGWVGLAVYLALLAAKSALVVAVRQAGEREIEARKTELAMGVEEYKRAGATALEQMKIIAQRELAQELERARTAAARELEQFKSELTLTSEARRQVAALKVKALLDFLRASQAFMRDAFNVHTDDLEGRARSIRQMHECFSQVREIEPLVRHEIYVRLSNLVSQIHVGADRWRRGDDAEVPMTTLEQVKSAIQLVREELGVALVAESVTEQSPPGGA
jgi:hypothetical protein